MNCNQVKSRYYRSSFLGHATHVDLLNHFNKIAGELQFSKLYQISMDGPNVNLKFYKEFLTSKQNETVHSLIDIGSCSLHVVHGSLKTGEEASDWKLKKIMKSAYYILHDSPARREDYASSTGSNTYPFSFCATRYIKIIFLQDKMLNSFTLLTMHFGCDF